MFRPIRLMLLALLLAVIPASSYAGVFISVGFAPPVLPVYVQPPCPEPGWMWTPGYWAYGADGYYWVPGTWVPAPYVGALWTPGYWGWGGGLYVWHPGYWGPHVGYYGGVNYGFGYMGVGFAGGLWVGGAFRYNTAVMHVGPSIHNTYVDTTIVHNTTIVNNNHVAYSGGPGGINHPPTAQENAYSHEAHQSATSYQTQHQTAAMHSTASYAKNNGGHPANAAMARPIGASMGAHANIGSQSSGSGAGKVNATPENRTYNASHSNTAAVQSHNAPQMHNAPQSRPAPEMHNAPQGRPAPEMHNAPQSRPAPQMHQAPPSHGGGGQQPHNEGGHEHGH